MKEIKFSFRMDETEEEDFKNLAKEHKISLASLIRSALYAVKNNPGMLNPIEDKTDTDMLLRALEYANIQKAKKEKEFENKVFNKVERLESMLKLLLTKAKIPKKELDKINKKYNGSVVFE